MNTFTSNHYRDVPVVGFSSSKKFSQCNTVTTPTQHPATLQQAPYSTQAALVSHSMQYSMQYSTWS